MNFVSRLNPLPPRLWGLLKRMERTGPRRAHRSRAGKISTEKSPKPYADMTGVFLKVKIVFKKNQRPTTEFFLEKVLETLSALGVSDQFAEVESPSFHPHLGWDFHPARMVICKYARHSMRGRGPH